MYADLRRREPAVPSSPCAHAAGWCGTAWKDPLRVVSIVYGTADRRVDASVLVLLVCLAFLGQSICR